MENQYQEILQKLETKRDTHPQLISLWIIYLQNKMNKLQNALDHCEEFMNNINDTTDIDHITLLTLIQFFN